MKIIKHENAAEFYHLNRDFLLKEEAFYNLSFGLIKGIMNGTYVPNNEFFYTIIKEDKIIGFGMRSNLDKPIILSRMNQESISLLVKKLEEDKVSLAGVNGPVDEVEYFSSLWKMKEKKLVLHLGVYSNTKLIPAKKVEGTILSLEEVSEDIIKSFILGFNNDCFPDHPMNNKKLAEAIERQRKTNGLRFLKVNGEIVAMTSKTRGTENGQTLSFVYTPDHLRGKGFASYLVSELTAEILKEKIFASLYTDLKNPTSNSIYQKIGYVKIGENKHYDYFY